MNRSSKSERCALTELKFGSSGSISEPSLWHEVETPDSCQSRRNHSPTSDVCSGLATPIIADHLVSLRLSSDLADPDLLPDVCLSASVSCCWRVIPSLGPGTRMHIHRAGACPKTPTTCDISTVWPLHQPKKCRNCRARELELIVFSHMPDYILMSALSTRMGLSRPSVSLLLSNAVARPLRERLQQGTCRGLIGTERGEGV